MPGRKRTRDEVDDINIPAPPQLDSMLVKLRNTWEFANLMQYIFLFGKAVKIDEDFDIETLEHECLKPGPSEKLKEIGLCLLKNVSSHRGLTPEIFDEYTRRQYLAKAPDRNPFGEEEEPKKFDDFDIFTKLRVLVQLSIWTFNNAERMREKMAETKDNEQIQWRIEEIGYDKQERLYFVLDDNRLYRRTDPPIPAPPSKKPKANSKKGRAAARAAKRRKIVEDDEDEDEMDEGNISQVNEQEASERHGEVNTFGDRQWECVAVTLTDYRDFLSSLSTRHPDEKLLHQYISQDVMPIIEKAEESQQRKQLKIEREMQTLHKLATAKRSSRLADKQDKEQAEREAAEAERKRRADLDAALRDQERQQNMAEQRESRMMTREQRLKDREYKRILHEEELKKLAEHEEKVDAGEARLSERNLKAEMARRKKQLEELEQDDDWTFDCSVCGVHGENWDDGTHSVACEKCNVWQHSSCLGISKSSAESPNFHFICADCKAKAEEAARPKPATMKLRMPGASSSPPGPPRPQPEVHIPSKNGDTNGVPRMPPMQKFKPVEHKPVSKHNSIHAPGMERERYRKVKPLANRYSMLSNPPVNPSEQQLHGSPPVTHSHPTIHTVGTGHTNLNGQPNGFSPYSQPRNGPYPATNDANANTHQSIANPSSNGQSTGNHTSHPPPVAQTPQSNKAPQFQTPNPILNPFHHQTLPAAQLPSPLNGPTLSPPSHSRPSSSHHHPQDIHQTPLHQKHTPAAALSNGHRNISSPSTIAPLLPSPAAFPPIKHDSPPHHPSPTHHRLSSSPVAQPPPPLNRPPSQALAGISPVKQSPPRPGSGFSTLQNTPVVMPPPTMGMTMTTTGEMIGMNGGEERNGVYNGDEEADGAIRGREREGSPVKEDRPATERPSEVGGGMGLGVMLGSDEIL